MTLRHKGRQTVTTTTEVYETECDQCAAVIEKASLRLSWPLLDDYSYLGSWEGGLPESPVDFCSTACLRAFLDRAESLIETADSGRTVTDDGR